MVIELAKIADKKLVDEIIELGGEDIKKCFQCGTCVADCITAQVNQNFRPRKLIRKILLGLRDEVLDDLSIWECTVCHICTERCPRGANPAEIVLAARRLLAADLGFPMTQMNVLINIKKVGHAMEIEHAKKLRKKVGLEELPPTACRDPKAIEEITTLLDKTKLAELRII